MPIRRRTLTLVVMCVGTFLVLLDVTVVNVALPRLRADLGAGVGSLRWIVDGYAVALAAFMLPCGDFGDRHGHKRVVLAGLATFGLGSLGAGLAPGPGMLIAAGVQGAGAALLLAGTLAVVSRSYENRAERARAIGIWAAISALALPAGIIAGGALVKGPGWRWAFLVNLPVIAIALPVAAAVVRETREPSGRPRAGGHGPRRRVAGHADLRAHRERPTAGVAAVALAGTFVVVERRRPEPMLPISLFRRPAFTTATGVAAVMNLGSNGTLFALALFLQDVQGRSPLGAGLVCLPAFATLAPLAWPAGRAIARFGPRGPMVAGLLCAAAGLVLLRAGRCAAGLPALGRRPRGVDARGRRSLDGGVGRERAGLGAAVRNTARQAGGALGVAAFGSVAGHPSSAGFVHGFPVVALGAAGLYACAAAVTLTRRPGDPCRRPRRFARPARPLT